MLSLVEPLTHSCRTWRGCHDSPIGFSGRHERGLAAMAVTGVLAVLVVAGLSAASAPAATSPLALTVFTDQLQSTPFLGLGVEFDPYDTLSPTTIDWPMIEQRLDFMSPGFLRVVEPASDYFGGYNSAGQPTYTWTAPPGAGL